MRLIDADTLIEEIKSLSVHVTGLRAGRGVLREFMDEYRKSVLRVIEEQPTAYDPDRIAEKLEEEREYSYADFTEYVKEHSPCLDDEYDDLFHRGLERAIRIVKDAGKE